MTRLALSALLATLALFGAAPQALAHTELVSSDPANGATLPQRPTQLTLTFTEPVPAESATATVLAPDGSAWRLGEITAQGTTLTVAVTESGSPAGPHTLDWVVESLDGDFVQGRIAFTLPEPPAGQPPATTEPATTEPAAPTAATTTTDAAGSTTSAAAGTTAATTTTSGSAVAGNVEDDGGVPLWVWILVVAVLSVIGIAVAVGLARRTSDPAAAENAGTTEDTGSAGGGENAGNPEKSAE